MYRSQPRGPAHIRTTASGPGSGSYPAPSSSSQVEGSSKSSGNLASALAQRPPGGYTALAPGQGRGEGRDMVAGEHVKFHSDAQSVKRFSYKSFSTSGGPPSKPKHHCFEYLYYCFEYLCQHKQLLQCIAVLYHLLYCLQGTAATSEAGYMQAWLCCWQALLMAGHAGLMLRGAC